VTALARILAQITGPLPSDDAQAREIVRLALDKLLKPETPWQAVQTQSM
jgi:hypothetical protein